MTTQNEPETQAETESDCWCGADGGEGCYCCTDDCPEDCMADHRGEQ
jgi:hypothetical protein